jgi:hypothetical protein
VDFVEFRMTGSGSLVLLMLFVVVLLAAVAIEGTSNPIDLTAGVCCGPCRLGEN